MGETFGQVREITEMTRSLRVLAMVVFLAGPAAAQDTSPVVVEGAVAAPVDTVWAAWTTNEGLRSWYTPHSEIDLRIGGLLRANYDSPGALGGSLVVEREILSFEPNKMLSVRVVKLPDGFPFVSTIRSMWTVVYFDPLGQERTQVRVVSLGLDTSEESRWMRAFFEQENRTVLQQLQNHFLAVTNR